MCVKSSNEIILGQGEIKNNLLFLSTDLKLLLFGYIKPVANFMPNQYE